MPCLLLSLLGLGLTGASAAHAGLCEAGLRQSPIDITETRRQALPALQFDYRASPLVLAHDGHTLRVRFRSGGHLTIGQQRFTLYQFHFHTPGGERLAGRDFPMAAHLLHRGSDGRLLALVVWFRLGTENALLRQLLSVMPVRAASEQRVPDQQVNAADLLPKSRGYYRYSGSLTAPPCTEGVEWIVLKQPLELSASQLARYRQAFADNARAVQPLHRRVVLESLD